MNSNFRERFEAKFTKSPDGCWLWAACRDSGGYGGFQVDGRLLLSHRVAYELYVGPIPDGLYVCHTCDVKPCVRPDHLWLGTHDANMADMASKGRAAKGDKNGSRIYPERRPRGEQHYTHLHPETVRGDKNGNAKLSESGVLAIRAAVGMTQKQIAIQHGVDWTTIGDILRRKTWKHI